jgi:Ca2+/Na+ antiporter
METVLYPLSTFLLSILTLSTSTTTLVTSTSHLSQRFSISPTLISLLTLGIEWEELALIVASLALHRPHLALGNILGSCVANIIGAFSLGVLAQRDVHVTYDVSAKIYVGLLFGVTTGVALIWGFGSLEGRVAGALLVAAFGLYVVGVGWSIWKGVMDAPVDSDAEDGDSTESEDGESDYDGGEIDNEAHGEHSEGHADESTPLFARRRRIPAIISQLFRLITSAIVLSLSGYVLSHSSQVLASRFHISETVFGATLLSVATTVPEKFVAVVSGYRGHPGITIASTVGSNIFLLTLCLGITILGSDGLVEGPPYTHEIVWTWTTSAFLAAMVAIGTHRLVGLAMLLAYIAFLVLEFTLYNS